MVPQPDIERAKTAPILTVLAELGHNWAKQIGSEHYYLSPLRQEHTPSFCVRADENIWYDHGAGAGGNVLDLVMQLAETTFPDAVRFLLDYADVAPAPVTTTGTANAIVNLRREPLTDASLLRYLSQERGLDLTLLSRNKELARFLGQAVYERVGKPTTYRSVAWTIDAGGLVLKYAGFTSVYGKPEGKPGYTLVPAPKPNPPILMVFEGFMNYLSALVLAKVPAFVSADVLVLNSVTSTSAALALLSRYRRVELCLDNDKTGNTYTEAWLTACDGHVEVVDQRPQWSGFNDVNDWLCQRRPAAKPNKQARATSSAATTPAARHPGYGTWWVWLKWKTPRVWHATGQLMPSQVYNSDDDQYPSRDRIKAIMKAEIEAGTVEVARPCTKDADGKMKILEQWPKPRR